MRRIATRIPLAVIAVVAAALLLAGGVTVAAALSGDDEETLSGPDAERAAAAALEVVDGKVTGVEAGDDEGASYEVEVRTSDGEVEVLLDEGFRVLGSAGEQDDSSEESPDDDREAGPDDDGGEGSEGDQPSNRSY